MSNGRSLGGIGRLYRNDTLVGEVYYSIQRDPPHDGISGSIVFVGIDLDLPNDNQLYRLSLEDDRYLILSLSKEPTARFTPYSFTSSDGIFHSTTSHSFS